MMGSRPSDGHPDGETGDEVRGLPRSEDVWGRSVPGGSGPGHPRQLDPRRKLAAIGLAAAVIPLALMGTALGSLSEVNDAHRGADRITAAQVDFILADMAHDTIRGDVLAVTLAGDEDELATRRAVLTRDVAQFRDLMGSVDAAELPGGVREPLREVRPLQEDYADHSLEFNRMASVDRSAAKDMVTGLEEEFNALTPRQALVTEAMSREAAERQDAASEAERTVRTRIVGSAAAAFLATLALALLLHRLGGTVAAALARERGVAELLQHSLLPDSLPDVPGVRLAARYVPAAVGTEVGGDWYDVIHLPSGEVGLVMGDVVGHDLDAAASMGQLRNGLRACAAEGDDPGSVLERLNRLCMHQGLGGMATVMYAVLDPVTADLRVASAGHYPPLLVNGLDSRYLETAPCPPIGALREVRYPTTEYHLAPGSVLVLYTDGLVERRDVAVDVGLEQLERTVAAAWKGDGLEILCDQVLSRMLGGRPADDDVALLTVSAQQVLGPHLDFMLPAQAEQLSTLRATLERWLTEAGATEREVYEITVAMSEAATNAIEHAYGPGRADIQVVADRDGAVVELGVRDWGQWRAARGRDRGRGIYLMRELMDHVRVAHGDRGTQVVMRRRLGVPVPGHEAGEAMAAEAAS
jgi:serine phosphatase RsbU (regulator of sigma subunit)/anti-sigma regulatory factor (Ser/Thr protein kinase)